MVDVTIEDLAMMSRSSRESDEKGRKTARMYSARLC